MSQARGIGGKGVNAYLFSCPPREHTRASHTSTTSSSVGMMGLGGGGNGGVGDPTMGYSHRSARPSTSSSSSAVELEALPCTPFPCPVPAGGGGGGTGWSRRKRSTGAPSETKGRAALRTTSPVLLGVAKEEDEEEDEDEGIAGDDKEEEEEGGDDDEAAAGRREGSKSYTSSSGSKRKKRRTRNGWSESGGSSVVTVKSVGGGGGGPLSMPNHPLLTSHLGTPPYRESMCSSNSSRGARPLFFASHRPSTGPTATTPTPGVGWSSSSLGHQSMFWNERERKRFSRARHHHYPPVLVLGRRELIPSVPSGLRFGSTSSLPDAWMYATGGGGSGSGAGRRGWQESTSTTSSSGGNGNTSPGKGRVHRTYSLRSSSSCSSSMAVMAGGGTTEHWKEKSVETGVAAGEEEEVEGEGEGEEGGGGRHHTWNGGLVEDRTGSGSSSGGSWNCHRGKREEASPLLNAFSIASNAAAGGGMAARSGGSSGTGIGGGGHSKASPPHHRPNSSSDNGSTSATPIAINASGSSTGMIGFVGPCTPGLSSSTSPFSLTGFSASAGASVESYYSFSSSTKNPAPPPPPPLLPLPPRSPPAYYRVYGFHTGEDSTDVNSPASSPIEGSYRADTPHPFTPSSPALSTHPMASASSSPKFEATPTSPPFTRPITHFVPPSGSTTTTTSFRDAPYGRHHRVSDTRPTSSTSELGLFHERSEDQNDDAFGKKKEKPPLPWKPQQGEEHQVSTTVDRPVLHSPLLPLSPSLPFPSSAITSSASFRAGMTPPSSTTLPSRGVISTTALVPPPMRREGKTFPRLTKSTVTEDDEDATTSSSPPSSLPFPSSSEEEAPQTSATHAEGPCHDLHQVVENEKNLSFPTSQGPPHRHHHHTRTPTQIHAAHFLPTDGPDSSPSVPSLLLPSGTTIITTPGRAHRLPRMERPTRRGLAAPTGGGGEEAGGGEQDGGESQSESILSASSEGEALGIPPPPSPFPLPVLPRLPPFSIPSSSTALSWRPVDRAGYRAPWESTATTTTNTMMEGNGIEKVSTMTTTTGASKGPSLGWENLSNDPVGGGEAGGVEWHGIGGGGGGDVGPFTMSTTNEDVTARGGGGGLLATDLIFGHSFGSSLPLRQHTTVGVNVAVVPLEAHVQRVDANEEAAREPLQGEGPSKKNPSPPPPHHHPTRMTKSPFPSSPGSFGSSPSSFYNSSSSGSTPFSASHENKTAPDPSLPPPSSVAAVPFPYFHPILYALHPHEEGEGAGFVGSAGGVGRVVVLGGEDERGEMDEDTTSGGGGGEHLLGHASIYSCSIKSPVQGHTTAPGSVIWRDTVGKLEDEEEEEEVDEEGNTRATRRKFRPKEEGMGARPTILHEVEVPGEQEAQRTRMATAGAPAWTPFSSSFVGSIKGGGGWMPFHGSSGGGEASSGAGPASRAMSKLVSLTVPESPPTRVPQETKEKEEEKEEKEATPTQTREVEGNVSRTTYAGKPSHQGSGGDDKQQKGSHENDKKEEEKHTKESKKRKEEEEERYPSSASTRTEGRQVRGMTGTDVVVAAMSTTPSSSLTPTTTTTATYTKKMEEAAQRWKALMEKPSCGKTGRESTKR